MSNLNLLDTHAISCPYCGEPITLVIDHSVPHQEYVEDCEVCCCPIVLDVSVSAAGDTEIRARREDD